VTVWRIRGRKRTHLTKHRLASYPVKEVAVCGVTVGVRSVDTPTIAYQDWQLTCPKCLEAAPWRKREGVGMPENVAGA
jgi:hypothetical protein